MNSTFSRWTARLLACFALTVVGAAHAAPPQLLLPHGGAAEKADKAQGKPFKSDGFKVQFNLPGVRGVKHGDHVDLALPNGKTHRVVKDLVQEHEGGDVTFYGHIVGDKGEKLRVVITTGAAGSFGRIVTPEGDFRLVPGEGHDWLIDMVAEQEHIPFTPPGKDYKLAPARPKAAALMGSPDYQELIPGVNSIAMAAAPSPQVFVDLMIVYTPAYAASLGSGLTTRLNNLIANMNTYLLDSEVAITLRLVHSHNLTTYSADATQAGGDALEAITNGTAPFNGIAALRNSVGADMVMFLRNGSSGGGSGIAWVSNRPIDSSFAPYTYSVVTGCLSFCDWVHMHEIGHNMGLMHDRATATWENGGVPPASPNEGSHPYAYGFYACMDNTLSCSPTGGGCATQPECSSPRSSTNNFADIMAYFHGSTTRNMKFSNPQVLCRGALNINLACGVATGSGSADAARALNENRAALSALRASTVVTQSPSTTALASSLNPSTFGQTVTFTATVTGAGGTPTGSVTFRGNGGMTLCASVTLSSGVATCANTAALAPANHSITAVYSGDAAYTGSTSSTLTQTVNFVNPTIGIATSRSPVNRNDAVVFTATVAGSAGTPTGVVEFRAGGSTMTGCAASPLSAGVATCTTNLLAPGTHSITAVYRGNSVYNQATSSAVTQVISPFYNVALSFNGGTASASSTNDTWYASRAIDNERAGASWALRAGGWMDNTADAYPDWLQVNFDGNKAIDRVVVYTVQDNYASPIEPTDSLTFSAYGIRNFTVQGWNGSAWVTLATVTDNNLVKRSVTFSAFTTSRIRVNVTSAAASHARITEVEAWGEDAGAAPPAGSNMALASAGATASASSTYGSWLASRAIDNERAGAGWGSGVGGWVDATPGTYPDWLQVSFNGNKIIDRVVVYTLQDNFNSPVEPTDAMGFTSYGIRDFTVQGWNGSAWVTLATVTGNTFVKRSVIFSAFTTDRIRIQVTNGAGGYSRITEVEAWGEDAAPSPPPSGTNMALASAGAVASASSAYGSWLASRTIDNERTGAGWVSGLGGWVDATPGTYPDWLQVAFNGTKAIDRVVVYTLQDNYNGPIEPSDSMTFANYGLRDFTVQGWNGSAWVTLATVTGNNLVKRTVTFSAFTTDRIRVHVTNGADGYSRIIEVEAWGNDAGASSSNVALASAGAIALASSTYGTWQASNAIDDERAGTGWASGGGGWVDATAGSYPDWLQVNFGATRTIDRVVVYTLQDNYTAPATPNDAMTFTTYGVRDFTVEGFNGSAWVTLGTVSGNNLVKRTVTFSPYATDRVRVTVTNGSGGYSRITEIEAWGY